MKKLLIFTLLLTSFIQLSCNPETISNTPPTNPVDVYVAGSKNGKACYWKNNQLVMLDSGVFTDTYLRKVVVSNGNLYAFGHGTYNINSNYTLLWKNGVLSDLETQLNTTNYAYFRIDDMEIEGNDEYFIGSYGNQSLTEAKTAYWKNGVKTIVTDGLTYYNTPKFKVKNNNVYVVFNFNATNGGYYLNGIFNSVLDTGLGGFGINNNDVYVIGYKANTQTEGYYINTTNNSETIIPSISSISFLFFDNNNIYYSDSQKIFKNGNLIYQTLIETITISDLIVQDDVLYKIAGTEINNQTKIVQINDTTIMTEGTNEHFNSLFIVQN